MPLSETQFLSLPVGARIAYRVGVLYRFPDPEYEKVHDSTWLRLDGELLLPETEFHSALNDGKMYRVNPLAELVISLEKPDDLG